MPVFYIGESSLVRAAMRLGVTQSVVSEAPARLRGSPTLPTVVALGSVVAWSGPLTAILPLSWHPSPFRG
jgi:hypothetical protein